MKQSPQNTALPSQQIRRTSFSSDTSKVGLKNVVSNFEIIGCGKESQICRFASFDIRNSNLSCWNKGICTMSFSSMLASFGKKRSRVDLDGEVKGKATKKNGNAGSSGSMKTDPEPIPDNAPPHYVVLGAQKAGTMAVVKNLNKHPDIFCLKEPHYFDLAWHAKTPDQYRREVSNTHKKICGEKTPELIFMDDLHVRMKQVLSPKTKFLLFLRDPIKRAYSAWNMNINRNYESSPFDEVCDRNFRNLDEFRSHGTAEYQYVQRGFYLDQIERFLKVFPNRDNFKVIIAEDMLDPEVAKQRYAEIFEYLGADPFNFTPENEHVGDYSQSKDQQGKNRDRKERDKVKMSDTMELKLMKLYRPHNERLFKWLGSRIESWTSMQSIAEKKERKERNESIFDKKNENEEKEKENEMEKEQKKEVGQLYEDEEEGGIK